MNAMTETKPIFEYNKTYRTRCGQHVMHVRPVVSRMLRGYRVCDDSEFIWYADGRVTPGHDNFADLMPGAIEDEKIGQSAPFWQRMEGELRAQASVIADVAAKIEDLTKHLDENAQHIGTLQTAQRLTFDRLDRFAIELGGKVNARTGAAADPQAMAIAEMYAGRGQANSTIPRGADEAATEAAREAVGFPPTVTVDMRLTIPWPSEEFYKALDATGCKTEGIAEPGKLWPPASTKRTIKGGWLNVYENHCAWHPSRDDADDTRSPGRLACIPMPDVIEGQGV